jgi:hypothetical protein
VSDSRCRSMPFCLLPTTCRQSCCRHPTLPPHALPQPTSLQRRAPAHRAHLFRDALVSSHTAPYRATQEQLGSCGDEAGEGVLSTAVPNGILLPHVLLPQVSGVL